MLSCKRRAFWTGGWPSRYFLTRYIFDGPLAVYVFFVLSGDALSLGYTGGSSDKIGVSAKTVLKRYFRLSGPVIFSCVFVLFLMSVGLTFNHQASDIVNSRIWLGSFIESDPSVIDAVMYGAYGVFSINSPIQSYNPFMWPMSAELRGSFLVFAVGFILPCLKHKIFILCILAAALFFVGSLLSLFVVGIIFGLLRRSGHFQKIRLCKRNRILVAAMFLLICVADIFAVVANEKNTHAMSVLASMIVYAIYCSDDLLKFMNNPLSQFFGKISFPMYYMQFSVIVSYSSWCIYEFYERFSDKYLFSALVSITTVLITIVISRFVALAEDKYLSFLDAGAIKILRYTKKVLQFPGFEMGPDHAPGEPQPSDEDIKLG